MSKVESWKIKIFIRNKTRKCLSQELKMFFSRTEISKMLDQNCDFLQKKSIGVLQKKNDL
mgnify:CR=1 FL=1